MSASSILESSRQEVRFPHTLDEVRAEKSRRSLAEYIRQAWSVVEPATPYVHGWHLDAIADHLQAVSEGEIHNLVINMPPRHMKSLAVSVFWPTWEWIDNPGRKWLFASYGQTLATRDALASRRLIQSMWYQQRYGESFSLTGDQNAKTRYDNDHYGYRISTSVGGVGTGEGGDRLVIDDPHKTDEADSDALTELVAAVEWHNKTWSTRANSSETARVVVMQRIHERDVTGDIIEKMEEGGRRYEMLVLPAEYEPQAHFFPSSLGWKDPRTGEGELLWPERFSSEELEALKIQLKDAASGQLQQRPAPAGGAIFEREWFDGQRTVSHYNERIDQAIRGRNRYDITSSYLKNFVKYRWLSYDTAFKDKDSNDATGKVVFEMLPDYSILVRFAEEVRLTVPQIEAEIETDFIKWNYDEKLRGIIVEDKGSGIGILQTLRQANPKIAPYLIAFDPKQDSKEFRARQASVWLKRDCIWIPEPSMQASWLPDFEDALFSFPYSRRKDMVDAFTQFILYSEPRIARGWRARSGFNMRRAS